MRRPQAVIRDAWRHLAHSWRTSIQLRVIGSVFMSSLVVIVILGFVLISFVGQQLLTSKHSSATEEMDRARAAVEEQIRASDTSNSLQVRLNAARSVLSDRTSTGSEPGAGAVYDPVLVAPDVNGGDVSSPAQNPVPESLREFVRQGQVSVQYATIPTGGQTASKTLIIGSPVAADIPGLELYLIMPLDNEESTLTLMRGLLSAGAIVLLVLLVVIAWVFSQQLTVPIRTASRIAERFATGHLRERMVVDGQDEVARLATSFNEMAEKLSRQIRQLKEFGDLQRQFTSDVSHELRTPLTTVRMAADLIHDNAEDLDPMTRRASELMNTELDRFESLLGDLLEISRHDAGVANLSAERVDIRGAVKSALGQVRAIAEDVGCEFVVDLPEDPVMVRIDSRRVERVLRNLLANAVDHSEGNPVNVTLRVGTESLAVTVVDHGMGLKPGEADLVFNRFWRSDPSRERRTGGTGLGLAIAKEDAQLHGGRLEATGEPGLGACFRLTLPLDLGTRVTASPLPLEIDRPTDADPDTGAGADAGAGAGGTGARPPAGRGGRRRRIRGRRRGRGRGGSRRPGSSRSWSWSCSRSRRRRHSRNRRHHRSRSGARRRPGGGSRCGDGGRRRAPRQHRRRRGADRRRRRRPPPGAHRPRGRRPRGDAPAPAPPPRGRTRGVDRGGTAHGAAGGRGDGQHGHQ
ncbi:HAMP domain-containing histidine kinase [Corynebacterium bovis]|nr:MtrAB system histidine kinase MtrB [Corynebacterium bovis]QQC48596.1 HAMP domain-containing histidine kinase [Corynebacterium bovis]